MSAFVLNISLTIHWFWWFYSQRVEEIVLQEREKRKKENQKVVIYEIVIFENIMKTLNKHITN